MTRGRAQVALVFAAGLLALATACTSDGAGLRTGAAAKGPAATASAEWPEHCLHVTGTRDYFSDPRGFPSQAEALLAEAPGPGHHLERVAGTPGRSEWWIVNDKTDEIYAQTSAQHGQHGWYVSTVERCSGHR